MVLNEEDFLLSTATTVATPTVIMMKMKKVVTAKTMTTTGISELKEGW